MSGSGRDRGRRGNGLGAGLSGALAVDLTLAVYARQMDRRDGEPERLKALVEGRGWVATGSSDTQAAPAKATAGAENGGNRR